MDPIQYVSQFLSFSPVQWSGIDERYIPPVFRWLLESTDAWYEPVAGMEFSVGGQYVLIFSGESGVGKTTQIGLKKHGLMSAGEKLFVDLDFTYYATDAIEGAGPGRAHEFWRLILKVVDLAALHAQTTTPYNAALFRVGLDRLGMGMSPNIKAKYQRGGSRDAWKLEDVELAACADLRDDILSQPIDSLGKVALEAVQLLPHRCIIVIDNVDHLERREIENIFRQISASMLGRTLLLAAVRKENLPLAIPLRQARPVTVHELTVSVTAAQAIMLRRCESAIKYAREMEAPNIDSLQSYISGLIATIECIDNDGFSTALINNAFNGDLRQVLVSLLQVHERHLRAGASIRTTTINFLLSNMPPLTLEMLRGRHLPSGRSRLLAWPELRLIHYLQAPRISGAPVPLARIEDDWKTRLSIPRASTRAVVESLSQSWHSGKLLRIEPNERGEMVVPLPAARVLQELTLTVEWLAAAYSMGRDDRSTADGERDTEESIQAQKVRFAVAMIGDVFRLFKSEHPYAVSTYLCNEQDRVRVRAFAELFGYGPPISNTQGVHGQWFIDVLCERVADYARGRGLDPPDFRGLDSEIDRVCASLNEMIIDA